MTAQARLLSTTPSIVVAIRRAIRDSATVDYGITGIPPDRYGVVKEKTGARI